MDLSKITALFYENFTLHGELGASLAVWENGREVLSLAAGFRDRAKTLPWEENTAVLVWSATKGPAAACVLHACENYDISLQSPVAEFWPEFAAAGKADITVAQVLSHQAGLAALTVPVSVLDYPAVIKALEEQVPHRPLGATHGYHPRTFGFLLDEIVRRVTGGTPLRDYWRLTFAEPLGLDFSIGLAAQRAADIAPVFPAKSSPPAGDPFYSAFLTPGSFTARAFASPSGLHSVASMNTVEARTASLPAFGGIGTASALAKFYSMLAQDGTAEGVTYFDQPTLAAMSTTLSQGQDQVLQLQTAFSAGFMRDPVGADGHKLRSIFGPSHTAFGHPGAGGSHAFADPEHRLGFAYVMNQMEPGVLPGEKPLRLVRALYGL